MLRLKHYRGQDPEDLYRLSRSRRAQYRPTRLTPGQAISRLYEQRGWTAMILGSGRDKYPRHWQVLELKLTYPGGETISIPPRHGGSEAVYRATTRAHIHRGPYDRGPVPD